MKELKLNKSLCIVRFDMSNWCARTRLTREDLPAGIDLPPEDIATLGSKKLYDPAKMKIFNAIRARARSLLGMRGVRFLDAYAVDEKYLSDVLAKLRDIKRDFDIAVSDFLSEYSRESQLWASQDPHWAHIIKTALPDVSELARRFRFTYQTFRIVPEPGHTDGLAEEVSSLVPTAIREISMQAGELLKSIDESEWTKRRLSTVDKLASKIESASFLDPRLVQLGEVFRQAYQELGGGGYTNKVTTDMFKALLITIRDEHSLNRLCDAYAAAGSSGTPPTVASVLTAFNAGVSPAAPAMPSVPAAPAMPSVPAAPAMPSVPAEPAMPSVPAAPAMPSVPAAPAMPPVPAAPAMPSVPAAPAMPSVPVPPVPAVPVVG